MAKKFYPPKQDKTDTAEGGRVDKEKFSDKRKPTTHKFNDVSWYVKNPEQLKASASFSYNNPLGYPVPFKSMIANVDNISDANVPGLLAFQIVTCPGRSISSTSPINIAAQNVYSFVRYQNSGSKNYDQADLMLYLLAADQLFSLWNWMQRMYGYLSAYNQDNWYMPKVYAEADHIDFDDFRGHISDFRAWLNQCAAEMTAFCVPSTMSLFVRHSWMFSNIYKDSGVKKAQHYMFTPAYFYRYDETGSQYGGQLVVHTFRSGAQLTFSQLQSYWRTIFDAMAYSEDIGVMSGDIKKAYGDGSLFRLGAVNADYVVNPVYNEEVLNQMHNSTVITLQGSATPNITQDPNTGFLIYNPALLPVAHYHTQALINMNKDIVEPGDTMVGTRLTAGVTISGSLARLTCCGTEFVSRRVIYRMNLNGSFTAFTQDNPNYEIYSLSADTDLEYVTLCSDFDWHPLSPLIYTDQSVTPNVSTFLGYMGDVSNYTVIPYDKIQQMHLTAIMSELNIPQLGSF